MKKFGLIVFLTVVCSALASAGTITTFFGEDTGLGEFTRLGSHPNADLARNTFLANLVGVGTENFESFSTGTSTPLALTFPGAGTATLNGNGSVATVPSGTNGVGRYPISGNNYWESSDAFSISFSDPIAAFGFYGVDIGDFNGQVTLFLSGGGSTTLTVPNTIGGMGGSVLYFGFFDTANTYTGISFGNTAAGTDFFGFDDMTVGSLQQVHPVPEPASLVLFGSGLATLAAGLRRKMKR